MLQVYLTAEQYEALQAQVVTQQQQQHQPATAEQQHDEQGSNKKQPQLQVRKTERMKLVSHRTHATRETRRFHADQREDLGRQLEFRRKKYRYPALPSDGKRTNVPYGVQVQGRVGLDNRAVASLSPCRHGGCCHCSHSSCPYPLQAWHRH